MPSGPITSRNPWAARFDSQAVPGPRARIHDEFERARPAAPARRLMDREVPAQHEVAVLGHRDGDELAGTGTLGDLGRDERERLVGAEAAGRQDLGADALHAAGPSASAGDSAAAAASNVSRTWEGRSAAAAWCSWIDRGSVGRR